MERLNRVFLACGGGMTLFVLTVVLLLSPAPVLADGDVNEVLYVAPSGTDSSNDCRTIANPCGTLQHAVDQADGPVDEIRVAQGTYTGVSSRTVPSGYYNPNASGMVTQTIYISQTLLLRGGYSSDFSEWNPETFITIIDAQSQGRGVFIGSGSVSISPTLEGFQITNGNASGLGGGFEDGGGGFYLFQSSATISNCQIISNTAPQGGGGYLYGSSATIASSVISTNTATHPIFGDGGGIYLRISNDNLVGNTIESNTAIRDGGGLFAREGEFLTIEFSGNTVVQNSTGNRGGGIGFRTAGTVWMTNTIVANNQAGLHGDGLSADSIKSLRMLHTTIANNVGGDDHGVYVSGSTSAVVMTNTIVADHGTGVRQTAGTVEMDGVLWYGNTVNTVGTVTVNKASSGDPVFVNSSVQDYHIRSTSAALDEGLFAGVTGDIDGATRPVDSNRLDGPDLGADEFTELSVLRNVASTMTFGAAQVRLVFTDTGNISNLTTTVTPDRFPTANPGDGVISRTIFLVPSANAVGYTATLVAGYEEGELNGLDESTLTLYRWNGDSWDSYSSTLDMTSNLITATNVITFGSWVIGGNDSAPTAIKLSELATTMDTGVPLVPVISLVLLVFSTLMTWHSHRRKNGAA